MVVAKSVKNSGIILYDYLLVPGGAEKLTLTLATALPEAAIAVAYRDPVTFPASHLPPNSLYEWKIRASHPAWRLFKIWRAFAHQGQFVRDYEWALFSGICTPAAVCYRALERNIYYCHTLPRFVYDLRDYYLKQLPHYLRPALQGLISYFQPRYEAAIRRMDPIIANSENVRWRIRHYLGREAMVIYPPVEIDNLHWYDQGDYYLSLARLEPLKRVNRIIQAFRAMPQKKLIIASGGGESDRLKRMAADAPNIAFTGWLSDEQLRELIGNAIATIYVPIAEDFGISPVESMAAGKPVIGVAEGGLLETVAHGETGLLMRPDPTPEILVETVNFLTPKRALAMRAACEARARLFSTGVFLEKMRSILATPRLPE